MAAARLEPEKKETGPSAHPAALFTKKVAVSSLQTMLIEELLATHGGWQNMLQYIKTDEYLSGAAREGLKNACRPKLVQELLQAMIDDNHQTVKMILDFDPELLLVEPADVGVTQIESKKTWQRFLTERPLIMMQKLKRLAMTKTLIPYMEKLDKKGETPEIAKQWILPSLANDAEQKEQDEKNEKLQQEYIKKYFEPLVETIAADNTVKLTWEQNSETKLYEARIEGVNEATASALAAFRKLLLPDAAIAIDDDVDNEQFQIAANKAYETLFGKFKNWDQRDVFAICGIGFAQSLSAPELGAIYCESLYDVVNSKKPASARAVAHKMEDGRDFYRISRDSLSGLGAGFLCFAGLAYCLVGLGGARMPFVGVLENYVKQM